MMETTQINVLIADDHQMFRQGILRILREHPVIGIIGEAGSGAELMNMLQKAQWHILVLDLDLPDSNGLEIIKDLRASDINVPILVLSMFSVSQFAVRSIRAGAAGYLTKGESSEELIDAIKKISSGGKYIGSEVAEFLADAAQSNRANPLEVLSDREYEVFLGFANGKTIIEISDELRLSPNTISTYRFRIMEKMEFKTNAELVKYAAQRNII